MVRTERSCDTWFLSKHILQHFQRWIHIPEAARAGSSPPPGTGSSPLSNHASTPSSLRARTMSSMR